MFAKRLFYASAAILCLALAYHFGATSATAQAPGNPVVAGWQSVYGGGTASIVMTANGDVYQGPPLGAGSWSMVGNIFGAPTPVQQSTFGSVKARYR